MKFTAFVSTIALAATVSAAASDCVDKIVAKEGDSCRSIANNNKISIQSFYRMNFDELRDGDCASLVKDTEYCLSTEGSLEKRNWFYNTKGLAGSKLALAKAKAAAYKKTTKKSTKKKTTKKSTKKTTKKKTTKKTTKKKTTKKSSVDTKKGQSKPGDSWSSTPKNAPSNAVRHITPRCVKYETVTPKKYTACEDFSAKNGITQAQLFSWNAGLHGFGAHECDNLDDGKAYCVKVK